MALETALSESTHLADTYRRCDPQQKAQMLTLLETKLRTAHQATQSLRSRVAAQRI